MNSNRDRYAAAAKTAATNKRKYGDDFYREIGRKGGSVCGTPKGFAANPELAKKAGVKGGQISRKGANKPCRGQERAA